MAISIGPYRIGSNQEYGMPLSAQDQRILSEIEAELTKTDPNLVATFRMADSPAPVGQQPRLSPAEISLLIQALLALVILVVLLIVGPDVAAVESWLFTTD
jgi:hypothetical protein